MEILLVYWGLPERDCRYVDTCDSVESAKFTFRNIVNQLKKDYLLSDLMDVRATIIKRDERMFYPCRTCGHREDKRTKKEAEALHHMNIGKRGGIAYSKTHLKKGNNNG